MFEFIEVLLESSGEIVMVVIMMLLMLWSSGVKAHLPHFGRRPQATATVVIDSVNADNIDAPAVVSSADILSDSPGVRDSGELLLPRIGFTDPRFPEHVLTHAIYTTRYPEGRVVYDNRDGPKLISVSSAPLSSLAELWNTFGPAICRESASRYRVSEPEVARRVETTFIAPASTEGEALCECIRAFQPNWYTSGPDDETVRESLRHAATLVQTLLSAMIERVATDLLAEKKVRAADCLDGLLVLETEQPWEEIVVNERPEVRFVAYRRFNGSWMLCTVPMTSTNFGTSSSILTMRVALPATWHGALAGQFVRLSGVADARVCDPEGRWCTAATRTGIERLAARAYSNE